MSFEIITVMHLRRAGLPRLATRQRDNSNIEEGPLSALLLLQKPGFLKVAWVAAVMPRESKQGW